MISLVNAKRGEIQKSMISSRLQGYSLFSQNALALAPRKLNRWCNRDKLMVLTQANWSFLWTQ